MFSIRLAAIFLAVSSLFGADVALLSLLPREAKVLGGVDVARAFSSPLGQHLLSRMNPEHPGFREFVSTTGFDPRRDLRHVVFASPLDPTATRKHGLMVARGVFNGPQIIAAAKAKGGTVSNYKGFDLLESGGGALAVVDGSVLLMGDEGLLKSSLDRLSASTLPQEEIFQKAQTLMNRYDAWLISTAPMRQFSAPNPNTKAPDQMRNNAIQAIVEVSGGAILDSVVQIEGEAVTRSEKDAQALIDVVRFLTGLVTLNHQNNPKAQQLQSLLGSLEMRPEGDTVRFAARIPEADLEQLLRARKARTGTAARK